MIQFFNLIALCPKLIGDCCPPSRLIPSLMKIARDHSVGLQPQYSQIKLKEN